VSKSAKHRDAAYAAADSIAASILNDLNLADQEPGKSAVVARLFEIVRARQKYKHAMLEAQGRLKARDRHLRHLVAAMANLHEQLEHCVAERDELRTQINKAPMVAAARIDSREQYLEACGVFYDLVNHPFEEPLATAGGKEKA
jgi:chromosome segregation ATPase